MELIKVTENNGQVVVSARELHSYLETETRFDIWVKRMLDYGFIENVDYQCLYKNVQMPNGGEKQSIDDFALTLECGKHLAMMQRTDNGMKARQYFIDVEKRANKPQSLKEALLNQIALIEHNEQLALQISEQAPKVEVYNQLIESDGLIDIGEACRVMGLNYGRNTLFKKLRDMAILMHNNIPYQRFISDGYFTSKEVPIIISGKTEIKIKTLVTQKGLDYLLKKLK